jgi:hypothetical protein
MKIEKSSLTDVASETVSPVDVDLAAAWQRVIKRRAFLKNVGIAAAAVPAGAVLAGTPLWGKELDQPSPHQNGTLRKGDAAILRFLAAAEIIESDLWTQYEELGGANGGNPSYLAALMNLDADMPQYITDNTDDELSHAAFINAYLKSKGAEPVNLDRFRTLPSSRATGAKDIGRLTNLMGLNVDTSFYTRYRSSQNPDLGATFKGPITITHQPAIPLDDVDTPPNTPQPIPPVTNQSKRMQAIANTASFHFALIEQGGSSLYTALSLKASDLEVLRIIVSIGGQKLTTFQSGTTN